jgi:hypothetical protein
VVFHYGYIMVTYSYETGYSAAEFLPFEGELYTDPWWKRVSPHLTKEGRVLVQTALTQTTAKLGEKERERFEEALRALRTPSKQQVDWLKATAKKGKGGEVRKAAWQKLCPHNLAGASFWTPVASPTIEIVDILICHPETGGQINWRDLEFPVVVKFGRSVFIGGADFRDAKFVGGANFKEACFAGKTSFQKARFLGETDFDTAWFMAKASFRDTRFMGKVIFLNAVFAGKAVFSSARFAGFGRFFWTRFADTAVFLNVRFAGGGRLLGCVFCGQDFFSESTFFRQTELCGCRFCGHGYV